MAVGNRRHGDASIRWLAGAVVVPLLVLAVLALLGIRAQTRAAWSAAREQAEQIAYAIAPELENALIRRLVLAPAFPDPPVPQPASSPADDPLAGSDPAALARLRDDPAAGLSASGLPRRVLAALRLLEFAPDSQSPESLAELVVAVPSVLTTGVLERLGEPARPALTKWREGETALALIANGNGWHISGAAAWWVERRDDGVVYLTPEAGSAALREHAAKLPPWAGLELVVRPAIQKPNPFYAGAPIRFGSSSAPSARPWWAPVVASAPVHFGSDLSLQVIAVAPEVIAREVRRQAGWTLSLLGVAVASACLAMWLMLRAVRQERRLAALKSQFVSSVSHELRAPIGSIRLMAEALHDGKVSGSAARDFHRLIAGESARLSQMVENVLDFARIEEGRKRYRFEETDLEQLAADTLRLLAPLAAERGITLVPELSSVTATVDPAAIQQALVNLLDNAIKFSPEGGTVTVGLRGTAQALPQDAEGSTRDACGPRWVLSVRDQGPGIPPAERERVFERFYRLGNELRRESQGAGIGLSIVKHIAEAHGGSVSVAAGDEGRGSEFRIETGGFQVSSFQFQEG